MWIFQLMLHRQLHWFTFQFHIQNIISGRRDFFFAHISEPLLEHTQVLSDGHHGLFPNKKVPIQFWSIEFMELKLHASYMNAWCAA
jgi:hypothetical protein